MGPWTVSVEGCSCDGMILAWFGFDIEQLLRSSHVNQHLEEGFDGSSTIADLFLGPFSRSSFASICGPIVTEKRGFRRKILFASYLSV